VTGSTIARPVNKDVLEPEFQKAGLLTSFKTPDYK